MAYHAAMSYNTILPEAPASSLAEHLSTMRAVSPVNDAMRSDLLSLLAAFFDTFMMSLMFLLSGLFVWRSLRRKGSVTYLRDRVIRLGIPILAMMLLRPLTYYPTYLLAGGEGGPAGFWETWSAIAWRGGPIWFLELLLVFDIGIALVAGLGIDWGGLARRSDLPKRALPMFLLLVVLTAIAYVPLTTAIGSFLWVQVGPAQIQVNRVLHYAVYFLVGVGIGGYGLDRSFLDDGAGLARRWAGWLVAALLGFAAYLVVAIGGQDEALIAVFLVVTCALTSFGFLALFLRFVRTRRRVFDSLFSSSYGIYIVHYGIVSFLAYALVASGVPAMAKFGLVFAGALALSWAAIAALRRIPVVERVI